MSKINKVGKSTFAVAILSFLLVAVLAFGGTYAYFSAKTTEATGSVTTGHIKISANDATAITSISTGTAIVAPGAEIIESGKKITATVEANINYYARVKFTVNVTLAEGASGHNGVITPANGETPAVLDTTVGKGDNVETDLEILNIVVDTAKWEEVATGVYYLKDFANAATQNQTVEFPVAISIYDWVGSNGCTHYMDAKISVTASIELLQADYLPETVENNATLHAAWDAAVSKAQPQD